MTGWPKPAVPESWVVVDGTVVVVVVVVVGGGFVVVVVGSGFVVVVVGDGFVVVVTGGSDRKMCDFFPRNPADAGVLVSTADSNTNSASPSAIANGSIRRWRIAIILTPRTMSVGPRDTNNRVLIADSAARLTQRVP
jgi:hypothetical protein